MVPPDVTLRAGESLVLRCNASGNPTPVVTWMKDDEDYQQTVLRCLLGLVAQTLGVRLVFSSVVYSTSGVISLDVRPALKWVVPGIITHAIITVLYERSTRPPPRQTLISRLRCVGRL